MAPPLDQLLTPAHTALVTQECQNGVLGEPATFPAFAEAARATMVPNVARLAVAARAAGVQVVHCVFERRPDGRGSSSNAKVFAVAARSPVALTPGTPAVEVIPEVGLAPEDLVLTRFHGVGPMAGTDLDPVLRNLGVRTIVAVGVSVNVGLTNLVLDAVNAGYQVVVPRDAVAGIPPEYADAVIDNTLSWVATITTTDEVVATWSQQSDGADG